MLGHDIRIYSSNSNVVFSQHSHIGTHLLVLARLLALWHTTIQEGMPEKPCIFAISVFIKSYRSKGRRRGELTQA